MFRAFAAMALALAGSMGHARPSTAEAKPMTFELRGGAGCGFAPCIWVAAEGSITDDTPRRLLDFLRANGIHRMRALTTVVISSPGGDLLGAVRTGRAIRAAELNTFIGKVVCGERNALCELAAGECFGVCAYMFAGGVRRKLHEAAELGVHQLSAEDAHHFLAQNRRNAGAPSDRSPLGGARRTKAVLSRYLVEMSVSPKLLEVAERFRSSDRRALDSNQLSALNVSTRIVRSGTRWQLLPHGNGLRLVGATSVWESGGSVRIAYRIVLSCSAGHEGRVSVHYAEIGSPIGKLAIGLLRPYAKHGPYVGLGDDRWMGEEVKRRYTGLQKWGRDTIGFSLYLTSEELLSVAQAKELRIGISMPSYLDHGPGSVFDLEGARNLIGLLSRRCVSK